jgi:hypothetical protein
MGDPLEERNRKFQKSDFNSELQKRQEFSVQLRKKKRFEKLISSRFKEPSMEMSFGPSDSCEEDNEEDFNPLKGDYVKLLKSLQDLEPSVLLQFLNTLVMVTRNNDEIQMMLINAGLVEKLQPYTSRGFSEEIRATSMWVFSNISASYNVEIISQLTEGSLVDNWFQYLSEDSQEIIEYSLMCLFNLACNNENYCKSMLEKGLLGHVKSIISKFFTETLMMSIAWGLSNFCHFDHLFNEEQTTIVIEVCQKLFNFPSIELHCKGILVLSRLIRNENKKVDLLVESPVFEKCFEFITNPEYHSAIITLASNVCSGTYSHTQKVLDKGILDLLWTYLNTDDDELLYVIYFSIQNIAAGTVAQLKILSSHCVFYSSLNGLMSQKARIRNEASYIVRNYLKHSSEEMKARLLNDQFVQAIIQAMEHKDPEFISNLLTVFEEFVKVKGNQEFYMKNYDAVVEKLQTHQNPLVFDKCIQILQSYSN